jgi:transcription antitermination factor NusG
MSLTQSHPENHFWYAIRVRSRFESQVSTILRSKGFEEFLPLYRSARRWSDRVKNIELPLFPTYLFCRFNAAVLLPILTTPGVIAVVGVGKTPVPVSDEEITALKAVAHSGLPAQPWPCLTVGDRVLIERGPLAGLEGITLSVDNKCRLVLSVPLLQRSVAVEIDRTWARPILNGTVPAGKGGKSQLSLKVA